YQRMTPSRWHRLLLIGIRHSAVRGIGQDLPHAGRIPIRASGWRGYAARDQPLRDAVQRQTFFDVPGEDLPHDASSIVIDLESSRIARPERIGAIAKRW